MALKLLIAGMSQSSSGAGTANVSNVTGTLSPDHGGTGVANNAASTLTISGNFASTLVVSGAFTYTMPGASGTLSTFAPATPGAIGGTTPSTVAATTVTATQQGTTTPVVKSNISTNNWGIAWATDGGFNVCGFGNSYLSVDTSSGRVVATAGVSSTGGTFLGPGSGGSAGTPIFSSTIDSTSGLFIGSGFSALSAGGTELLRVNSSGLVITKTITAAGTTGAQTINKSSGQVNFAAGATTLVVTNSLVATTSIVMIQVLGTDVSAVTARVTKASGSFTITLPAAATAETGVEFSVTN